jgi:hypothetical protein
MVPQNRINGFWFVSSKLVSPPDYRERRNKGNAGWSGFGSPRMTSPSAHQRPLSPEEIQFHALLIERLFALHRKRPGLWSKIRRFFWGDRGS